MDWWATQLQNQILTLTSYIEAAAATIPHPSNDFFSGKELDEQAHDLIKYYEGALAYLEEELKNYQESEKC